MKRHYAAFALLGILLSACATLGFESAKSFEDKLAYAFGNVTAVRETAAAGVRAGTLSSADGAEVLELTNEARALLDAARVVAGTGDTEAANAKLVLATAILTQLRNYLNARAKP